MPALLMLLGVPVLNYVRHRRGRSTICSTCRKHIGPRLMTGIVLGIVAWFLPHYCRPFVRAATRAALAAADTFDGELSSIFDSEE